MIDCTVRKNIKEQSVGRRSESEPDQAARLIASMTLRIRRTDFPTIVCPDMNDGLFKSKLSLWVAHVVSYSDDSSVTQTASDQRT